MIYQFYDTDDYMLDSDILEGPEGLDFESLNNEYLRYIMNQHGKIVIGLEKELSKRK